MKLMDRAVTCDVILAASSEFARLRPRPRPVPRDRESRRRHRSGAIATRNNRDENRSARPARIPELINAGLGINGAVSSKLRGRSFRFKGVASARPRYPVFLPARPFVVLCSLSTNEGTRWINARGQFRPSAVFN